MYLQSRKLVTIYDPVFSDDDVKVLEDLQLTCLTENKARHYILPHSRVFGAYAVIATKQDARHKLAKPTLVFMPHCDRHLYENILRENWGPQLHENMILIANRLTEYEEK